MKNISYAIMVLSLVLISGNAWAKAKIERAHGNICSPRAPAINLTDAIDLAKKNNPSLSESFIDSAELKCENKMASWEIGFRFKEYETGHFIVIIQMDGSVRSTVVKDG